MSKKSDKDFIAKLKTLTIGTGAKAPSDVPKCSGCGGKMHLVGIGFGVMKIARAKKHAKPDHNDEAAFSA